MFIKLKDNSPVPSCAIWLGNSLVKPAEEGGAQIYKCEYDETFTRKDNTFKFYLDYAYYKYKRVKLYVKNFKGESITLGWEYGKTDGTDQAVIVGKWDTTIENPSIYDDSQTQGIYWRENASEAVIPSPEDSGEHTIELWYYTGYYGMNMTLKVFPASLFSDLTTRFVADGYSQKYENEHYVRHINLAEEIQQTDGTWKKDGYYKEGELVYEYDGKVYAYWSDPKLKAKVLNLMWKNVESPIKVEDFASINSIRFDSGVTSIDYIDENIPINQSANYMFQNCSKLTSVPYFSLSGVTTAQNMFDGCTNLQTVPAFPFKNDLIEEANLFFNNCKSLKEINFKDGTRAMKCVGMFYGCEKLDKISGFSYGSCNTVSNMFNQCKMLYDLGGTINLSGIYKMPLGAFSGMFNGTAYLSDIRFSGTLRDSLSLDNHLTQRSIKDLIKACSTPLDTDAKTMRFAYNTVLINDEPDTYTPLINQAIESGWTFSNLNIVEPGDAVGFRYTTTDGRKLTISLMDATIGWTNSCQTDGNNGLMLWNGADAVMIDFRDDYKTGNLKSFNGFLNKTKITGKFRLVAEGHGEDAKWDFTNAIFSGASLDNFEITMRGSGQDGIYNLDLSGFDTSKYGTCVNGSETKNLRLTGSLDYSFNFNLGWSLNNESIKSILQACANSHNTEAKTLHTDVLLKYGDVDGSLTELLSQAIAKGWTIEGIEIIGKEDMVCVNYTTTDGQVPEKFKNLGKDPLHDASTYGKFYLPNSSNPVDYNHDWNGMDTLKTIDGADKELKCGIITFNDCHNLTKLDFKNIKFTNVHEGWSIWSYMFKLKEVLNLDFSDYAMDNIYKLFSSTPDVPEVRLTGSLNNNIDFTDAGGKFTYETIMSIVTACAASTNTNAKTCKFNGANVTSSEELTAKIKECTDKGWTFEGLTIN